tara:strand:- start:4281 stop:4751 length:471 start_codon:yes stop_codon:yes gene_type:complete
MAIKYYPQDVNANYGSLGIKFPMNAKGSKSDRGVFNVSYTTEEQAISNYINLLLTRPAERYMQPNFGIGLQERVFEQNTKGLREDIKLDITQQSQHWLPYIFTHSIEIGTGENIPSLGADSGHGIHIVITFSVTENGANIRMSLFQVDGITRVEVL